MSVTAKKYTKAKSVRSVPVGVVHILSTSNNLIINISDTDGNSIAWSSAGTVGFKGSRKSTPYAAQVVAEDVSKKVKDFGLKTVSIVVAGGGVGREPAIRVLANYLLITVIEDRTPLPHNGCRPRKRRRV